MNIGKKFVALLFVLALVAAACGDSSDDTTTTTAAPDTTAPTTTAGGGTDTTAAPDTTAPPATDGPMEIATDFGVDLEAGTVTVGLLSDLTGVFSALVNPVVTGYEAQVEKINANGGIHGLQIELEIRDTVYSVDTHVQLYNEIKDQVVMLGHSTGSPHSVAIADQMAEDGMLAVPLTWYSGWSDPALNANLIAHGAPYCFEAMNVIGYIKDENPDVATIAIASNQGDFGEDSAEGAKLAAGLLGLEIVYDGQGLISAADQATLDEVANGIVNSGADVVWVTTSPGAFSGIYGQTLAGGFTSTAWGGSFVAWNFGFMGPESPIAEAVQRDMVFGLPISNWSADNPGTLEAVETIRAYDPDAPAYEYYLEGVGEAMLMERILNDAYESGDMTRAGVLKAAKSIDTMSWDGLWPDQKYTGSPNDTVQRLVNIVKPNAADLAAGGSGLELLEADYTHPIAADFVFNETCFKAFG